MSLWLRTGIEFFYRMRIDELLEWSKTLLELSEG